MEKKYTNVHVGDGYSVKSEFAKPVSLEKAREHGNKEVIAKPYLQYIGVLGVDITTSGLKKILKEQQA